MATRRQTFRVGSAIEVVIFGLLSFTSKVSMLWYYYMFTTTQFMDDFYSILWLMEKLRCVRPARIAHCLSVRSLS